jgi:hypothetical protein
VVAFWCSPVEDRLLKFLPFILRHLQQAWIRTTSTVLAMGLCIFLFSALQTVLARLDDSIQARNPRRLVTTNVMEMSALPPSYAARIERVPGVRRATRIVMFGGFLRGRKQGKAEPGLESDWTNRTDRSFLLRQAGAKGRRLGVGPQGAHGGEDEGPWSPGSGRRESA